MQTSSSSSPVAIAILIALGSTVTVAGIAALRTRSFDERAALRATINEPAPSADNGSTALVVPTLPHERDDVEAKLEAAPFDPEVYLSGWGDEASQLRRECDLLRVQLQAALDRIAWLEAELAVRDPEAIETPVTAWIASLRDDERPSPDVVRRMSEMLRPYPVQLGIAEGTWIAERIVKGDWATFGATIDEALISFLGPARLSRELPPMKLAEVVSDWPEMFQAK